MSNSRSYERLPLEVFGRLLVRSGDLDPTYIALEKMEWNDAQLKRWLIAYWCFYDCGVACWLSEQEGQKFWAAMSMAAANIFPTPIDTRWPRAAERRHFRGAQAIKAVGELARRYEQSPEEMVDYIAGPSREQPPSFKDVTDRVKEHRGFGDWIAFKVADMLERLGLAKVEFTLQDAMYESPTKAAELFYRQQQKLADNAQIKRDVVVPAVVKYLRQQWGYMDAPPLGSPNARKVGLQEIETALCKWGSHLNGHYPLGKDTREIREGVEAWTKVSDTARQFLHWMPSSQDDGAGTRSE